LRKNTIVILTSDNGGMLRATDNRPLRSYKGDIYEGGIRVPCIIDWPGVTRGGSASDTPVHGVDFYATLLAMTGLPQQPEHHEDSVNLVPLLKGDTDFERGSLVWHYPVGVPHIAQCHSGRGLEVPSLLRRQSRGTVQPEGRHRRNEEPRPLDARESGGNEGSARCCAHST
jgi:hypothetical protein